MRLHTAKLRFRRKLRARRRQFTAWAEQLEFGSERYFFKRLDRLAPVRRFVITWLALIVLLCGCVIGQIRALGTQFQSLQPVPGGIYSEGILGDFTNASPLYASSQVDESVSKLVFASLFKYDDNNRLVGDLASSYSVDASGKIYTVRLKPHLTWHDGVPLTAQDVVFTYNMIQNPDTLSVLNQSWQGIRVRAINDTTVVFMLPNILGSFPYNMTNGIIPEHILKDVEPAEMRSISFNTQNPIGAGPFVWNTIEVSGDTPENRQAQIALIPFEHYNGGSPKLSSFIVHTFHDADQLQSSFKNREVTAASIIDAPKDVVDQKGVQTNSFMLSAATMVFFKLTNPVLAEPVVRKALVQAVNVPAIVDNLDYITHTVRGPFLVGQLGYDKSLVQPDYNLTAAGSMLDGAGWKLDDKGVRNKNGQLLRFTLYAQDMEEARSVTDQLAKAWQSLGVQVVVKLQTSEDLQRSISSRDYDALLYGISIGIDPDVFVYWHSSQTDARTSALNFSVYKSRPADIALEAGRTRVEPELRKVKYRPFLQAWQQDTPALGLYQPRFLYMTHGTVYGLNRHVLNGNIDRYSNVQNWQVRQADVTNR